MSVGGGLCVCVCWWTVQRHLNRLHTDAVGLCDHVLVKRLTYCYTTVSEDSAAVRLLGRCQSDQMT